MSFRKEDFVNLSAKGIVRKVEYVRATRSESGVIGLEVSQDYIHWMPLDLVDELRVSFGLSPKPVPPTTDPDGRVYLTDGFVNSLNARFDTLEAMLRSSPIRKPASTSAMPPPPYVRIPLSNGATLWVARHPHGGAEFSMDGDVGGRFVNIYGKADDLNLMEIIKALTYTKPEGTES